MISKSRTLKGQKKGWRKILFFVDWPLFCQILLLVTLLASTGIFIWQMVCPDTIAAKPIGTLNATQIAYIVICLSYVANVTNCVCLILASIKKISNYYWGIIACALLGIVSYLATDIGSWITYWVVQIPMQVVGVVMWRKNSKDKINIEPEGLKWYWYIIVTVILIATIGLFAWLESNSWFSFWYPEGIWKPNQWGKYITDAAVLMVNLGAVILMIKRYVEQWILWALLDIICIILWSIDLNIELVIMFSVALISCAYGIWDWWIKPSLKKNEKK